MKRFLAALICVVMVASVFSAYSVLTDAASTIWVYDVDKTTNVSAQRQKIPVTRAKSYTVTYSGTAADSSAADDGARLTDGNSGSSTSYMSVFSGTGTTTVVINIGYNAIGMTDFYARFHYSVSSGFNLPTSVKYYVSADGSTYNYAGEGESVSSPADGTGYSIGFTKAKGCAAQYVKVEITGSGKVACSEISCYIWADVTTVSASGAADSQGVVYSANVSAGTAYVTSYTDSYTRTETVQGSGITPCSATGLVNNTSYTIGKGTDDEVTVTADFISSSRSNRPGLVNNNKKYVVVHNTGNYASGATAKANHNFQTTNSSCTSASWHYTVGSDGIYQALPDNENAWHASDGSYGTSNYYGIGMEICVNGYTSTSGTAWTTFLNNTFYLNCRRAALLTAELCVRWGLDPGDCSPGTAIRQHWDTVQSNNYQKNCPEQMRYTSSSGTYTRNDGDLWKYYVGYVQKYYQALNGGGSYEKTITEANTVTNVEIPQYIYVSGSNVYCRVTGIASTAFQGKTNLVSVYLPNTISWGSAATAYTSSSNLTNINVSATNTYLYSVGGVLYSASDNSVVATPAKNSGNGVIKADPAVYGIANFTLGESYTSDYDADTSAKLFTGLSDCVSAATVKDMFVDDIAVYSSSDTLAADSDSVGTGTILKSADGEDTCVVIVYGDVDGDAAITSTDYAQVKMAISETVSLSGIYLKAATVSGNDELSTLDLLLLMSKLKG